jgi:hypothetical protein
LLAARPHAGRLKQRPDIRAAFPASLANEQRLKVGQPDVIRPAVRIDFDMVSAAIVIRPAAGEGLAVNSSDKRVKAISP